MADQNQNDQDQRSGGYGGSTGGQNPSARPEQDENASAAGRDNPGQNAVDADEALGNRTGGYGGNPSSVEQTEEQSR